MSDYLVETADGVGMTLTASTDLEACVIAKAELVARGLYTVGLNLFRYPINYVDRPSKGLIWVPLFRFL